MPNTHFPERLLDGYHDFRTGNFLAEQKRYEVLAKHGQRPRIMLIGCCDSRVAPETIFNVLPGEIFVLRNVANLVPPYETNGDYHGTSAALEFAVMGLGVEHIVVMGHGKCGGVHAALTAPPPLSQSDFIGRWISILDPVVKNMRANHPEPDHTHCRDLEHKGIQLSLRNLMTFPWIKTACAEKRLWLHGAWFDVALGELHVLDTPTGEFRSI
jgi:carbonic anhydrase